MVVTSTNNYFSYGITCAECNHRLALTNMSLTIPLGYPIHPFLER